MSIDFSSLGAFLATIPEPLTESLFVKAGGGVTRGTFHRQFPYDGSIASIEARYGIVFATTIGNTVGEREALDACIMGKLGFPEGYVITPQDRSDARIVAKAGGRAAWDIDPIRSADIVCSGTPPIDPPEPTPPPVKPPLPPDLSTEHASARVIADIPVNLSKKTPWGQGRKNHATAAEAGYDKFEAWKAEFATWYASQYPEG